MLKRHTIWYFIRKKAVMPNLKIPVDNHDIDQVYKTKFLCVRLEVSIEGQYNTCNWNTLQKYRYDLKGKAIFELEVPPNMIFFIYVSLFNTL